MEKQIRLFWLRRDLRLDSNPGLIQALESGIPVQCLFIFDPDLLGRFLNPLDRRVSFIHRTLEQLRIQLQQYGADLWVFHGRPLQVMQYLREHYPLESLWTAQDYEAHSLQRDREIFDYLQNQNIACHWTKDHLIQGPLQVLKADGSPYTVFTPYFKAWKARLHIAPPTKTQWQNLRAKGPELHPLPPLISLGFETAELGFELNLDPKLIQNYAQNRDFPSQSGTSLSGIHLRFGTVDPVELARLGLAHSEVWLSELAWRDFFAQILYHFPHSSHSAFKSFKDPKWEQIPWIQDLEAFEIWKEGRTGYPWVDAGMRQFKATGWMHNRVRMAVASFLCKHLLIDWRWGEAYFAQHLLDYDLSANVGNWQWAAGTGCDAQPWFRIFNPELQARKFDAQGEYLSTWIPEYGSSNYPQPMVDHSYARQRALVELGRVLKVDD